MLATHVVYHLVPSELRTETRTLYATIDAGLPTSSVAPLPTITPPGDFRVSWSGVDDTGGSGIATFDIYVSIDAAQPVLWMNGVTTLHADFTGADVTGMDVTGANLADAKFAGAKGVDTIKGLAQALNAAHVVAP